MANLINQSSVSNYLRIRQLLDKGEKHLHRIFRERWSIYHKMDYNISDWKNDEICGSELISFCTSISKAQKEILKFGKLDDWDISLTFSAIQGMSKEIRNYGGILDPKEDKLILDLKNERNKHAHGKFELSDEDFIKDWERLSNILIQLGENLNEIEEIKNKNFSGSQKNNTKTEYEKLKRKMNKLLKQKKYIQAIDICTQILQIPNLSAENEAIILSKQSSVYSMLETEDSVKLVQYADSEAQIDPSAEGQIKNEDWHQISHMPQTALNLDSRSTKLNNELLLAKTETRKSVLPKFTSIKFEAKFKKGEIMPNQIRQVFSNQPVLSLKVHVFESVNPNDYEKLVSYYTKAANDGIPEGMFYLAMLYESGTGIDLNEQETFQWLFKAATATQGKGIIEAQHSLGLRYYAGSGVNRNPQKAAEWFEKAVENGCEASANNLGVLYKFGEGVVQSSEKAFYYFKLAAENGDITGMQNLAHCYFTTQGTEIHELIEEHMKEGIKWMQIAENNASLSAVDKLESQKLYNQNEGNLQCIEAEIKLLKKRKHFNDIQRAAKNGSKTAEKVLNIWRHMDDAINAYEQNDATNLVAALSKAIRLDFETVQIPKLFKVLIEERIKTEEDDINTIVCFVHINMKSCDFPIYVVRYLNRYRFDEYLFEMLIYSFMQIGELEAGLNFAENASKTWPNSLRLKYCYAIALCKQDNPCPKVISALDAFINTAPPDHEKLPSCYYRKAEYYGFMKNNAKFIESYEAAQDSEKRQLPCF